MKRLLLLLLIAGPALGGETPGFLRGMGWSPWHATHGWNRPPEVVEQDYAILRDLHVNALRIWGPASRKTADRYHARGLLFIPQLRRVTAPLMQFRDGKEGHPVYMSPEARASLMYSRACG